MQFIGRHLNTIGILLFMTFCAAAAGLYWNVPERLTRPTTAQTAIGSAAVCPMHTTELTAPVKDGCCGSKSAEKQVGCSHGADTNSAMSEAGCSH